MFFRSIFKFLLIVIIICLFVNHANGGKIVCSKEGDDLIDEYVKHLYLWGSETRAYPTNQNEMQKFCRENADYQEHIRQYTEKCFYRLARQSVNIIMYSIMRTTNSTCKSQKKTKDFLTIGSCGNAAKQDTTKCWKKFIQNTNAIQYANDHKLKIPLCCCYYYEFKYCNRRVYEKPIYSRQCTQKAQDGQDKLIDNYALDVLKFLCGEYTEEGDKCDSVLHKLPKNTPKATNQSPLIPLVRILESLPE